MGYFSNGTEGDLYEERYCRRCVHGDGESAGECAVWFAHLLHNYDECNNDESILHLLIPRNGVHNEECAMFVAAARAALADPTVETAAEPNRQEKDPSDS